VNFKELRAQLKFEDVLRHYGVEIQRKGEQRKGEQHQGPCPLPQHGKERRGPAFSANLERGIFNCFGCGAKGNVLEFAALMSGVDAADGQALRKVAVELQAKFCPGGASTRTKAKAADAPVASAIKGTCDDLIVVEWFPSVWWLYQHDYANVVALMGPECSDEQANQIVALVKPSGRVWLVPSGTSDSRKLTEMVFALIACRRFVRWVTIGNGRQPSDLLAGEINSFFAL
jgi:hypothetical protein